MGASSSTSTRQSRVLVTDAGRGSAIAVIRSLGRRGFHVIAADAETRSPGFYSRYASERLHYPPPHTAPDEALEALVTAARERRVDLLVPVTDETLLPLAEARERFAGICTLAIPEPAALKAVADKLATLELASRLGIPIPRTITVTTAAEAAENVARLSWPVVLKPHSSRVYRPGGSIEAFEVAYAADPQELAKRIAPFEGHCPVLLQEYVRGEGHGVELLLDRGRLLAAFQHRRLREVPVTGGASSFRESVPLDPVLYSHSVRLLSALRWTGLAMVEFRVGAEGPKLMEVNGRIWGSLPLAVKSGIDFPSRMVDLYLGNEPNGELPAEMSYVTGVRSRNLQLEAIWIGSALLGKRRYEFLPMPRRRDGLAAAVRLAYPRDGYDVLSLDDPRPGLAELWSITRKLSRKLTANSSVLAAAPKLPKLGREAGRRASARRLGSGRGEKGRGTCHPD